MRIDNVSFPYPVLGISDDIQPTLHETGCDIPDIQINEAGNEFSIDITLKLENSDILNYIKNDYAEYSVEVSCKTTKYRKCMVSDTPNFTFNINKNLLNGKLEFDSFVIAKTDILDYKNYGLNPDYEGHTINLHKGDLLVAYRKCSFPVNVDLRNVRNMKSFMRVMKNDRTNERSVIYDLTTSKISILLPEEMMVEYNKKAINDADKEKQRKAVLKASLFLEALTYALLRYKDFKEREDLMWVNAITYRMQEPDIRDFCEKILNRDDGADDEINMDDLFKLAHMMLNQPYLNMLKCVSAKDDVASILTEE